jgi:hypothetical protein
MAKDSSGAYISASIYTLSDPRTGDVRYVGVTVQDLGARMKGHLRYKGKDHRTAWVQSLVEIGLVPVITEIDVVLIKDRDDAEQRWISFYRDGGSDLTNSTRGGIGILGAKMSAETRARWSEQRMGRPSPRKGVKLSAETKEKIRQNTIRQFSDPAQREAVSKVHRGKTISPEHRAIISAASTRRWAEWRASGQQVSEETREKIRAAAIARPHPKHSAESRARMSERKRQWWAEKKAAR